MTYQHTLTAVETACGVTLEQVSELLPKVLVKDDDRGRVIFPENTPPALAASVTRCVHAGQRATFLGFNRLDQPVYGKVDA